MIMKLALIAQSLWFSIVLPSLDKGDDSVSVAQNPLSLLPIPTGNLSTKLNMPQKTAVFAALQRHLNFFLSSSSNYVIVI